MACIYGIEQPCGECRMCEKEKRNNNMTNRDWVNGLSNEKLAEFIYNFEFHNGNCQFKDRYEEKKSKSGGCSADCQICLKEWLEKERD